MNGRGRVIVGLALSLLFVGGVGVGIALDRLWLRPSAEIEARAKQRWKRRRGRWGQRSLKRLVKRFRRHLDLTEAQTKIVGDHLRQMRTDVRAVRAKFRPEIRGIRAKARAAIEKVLRPDQQKRYREMVRRWQDRRKRRRQRRGR